MKDYSHLVQKKVASSDKIEDGVYFMDRSSDLNGDIEVDEADWSYYKGELGQFVVVEDGKGYLSDATYRKGDKVTFNSNSTYKWFKQQTDFVIRVR